MKYLTIIFLLVSLQVQASGFSTAEETRKFSDQTIELFVQGKFNEALNQAKPFWPIPAVEVDGLANQIAQQWPVIDRRFGASLASEFVRTEKIANSFVRHYYLHKFENHAIYWQIDFYKPKDSWKINMIVFLDSLDVLFE